jgi:hypothetical protein
VNADERDEIAASLAAHAELGPRYDNAVAEGLVERIGEEIDKRVDARLRGVGQHGSMGLGLGATAVVVSHHVTASAAVIMVLLIWAAIAVINIAHSQRR